MPQLNATLTHTERDATTTAIVRAYFQPHATSANTFVLGTDQGDATAWLADAAGVLRLDDDSSAEDRVPFLITSTLVIV